MNIETLKKLKETLGTKEANQLIGEFCRAYEFLRFNGTRSQIKAIYDVKDSIDDLDYDHNDNYVNEKTRKYFDGGSGFACYLDNENLSNLGKVLIDEIESGDLISIR
jgi:hypothetical protein